MFSSFIGGSIISGKSSSKGGNEVSTAFKPFFLTGSIISLSTTKANMISQVIHSMQRVSYINKALSDIFLMMNVEMRFTFPATTNYANSHTKQALYPLISTMISSSVIIKAYIVFCTFSYTEFVENF